MKIYGDKLLEGKGATSGPQKVKKAEKKGETSAPGPINQAVNQTVRQGDKVQISSRGKDIADLRAISNNLPETRDEKINALKGAINSGTYNVDAGKLAASILKEL